MNFAEIIKSHVARLGTNEAARICGVTPRSLQIWMNGEGNPNRATQVGALVLLRRTKTPKK